MTEPEGGFTVVGREADGQLIFMADNGVKYVSGETLEEFGEANLRDAERVALGLPADAEEAPK